MKNKKKRSWVWCSLYPVALNDCNAGSFIFGKRRGNKVQTIHGQKSLPNRVTCPICKRRFKPRIRECYDQNCWHVYIPAHKTLK